ncbi:MAG: FecR domain-containing protein [Limisphaerales bacterium]
MRDTLGAEDIFQNVAVKALAGRRRSRARPPCCRGRSSPPGARDWTGCAAESALQVGLRLGAGDTLEIRSCHAWIELELHDGSRLTLAGLSALRLLRPEDGALRVNLTHGNLRHSPASAAASRPLIVQTPAGAVTVQHARFNAQATAAETILRLDEDAARSALSADGAAVEVTGGRQVACPSQRKRRWWCGHSRNPSPPGPKTSARTRP